MGIRPLAEEDAIRYRGLRLRGLKEHPDAFCSSYEAEVALPVEMAAELLRRTADSPDDFTLGAYRDARLIGMVGFFRKRGEKERHRGTIWWGMYVLSEEQGKGVGRALLTQAVGLARLLPGLEQVELAVVTRNKHARSLYASLGFEPYGVEPRALVVDGEYLDEERMVLFLNRTLR